jgi:hypothetical protein
MKELKWKRFNRELPPNKGPDGENAYISETVFVKEPILGGICVGTMFVGWDEPAELVYSSCHEHNRVIFGEGPEVSDYGWVEIPIEIKKLYGEK